MQYIILIAVWHIIQQTRRVGGPSPLSCCAPSPLSGRNIPMVVPCALWILSFTSQRCFHSTSHDHSYPLVFRSSALTLHACAHRSPYAPSTGAGACDQRTVHRIAHTALPPLRYDQAQRLSTVLAGQQVLAPRVWWLVHGFCSPAAQTAVVPPYHRCPMSHHVHARHIIVKASVSSASSIRLGGPDRGDSPANSAPASNGGSGPSSSDTRGGITTTGSERAEVPVSRVRAQDAEARKRERALLRPRGRVPLTQTTTAPTGEGGEHG